MTLMYVATAEPREDGVAAALTRLEEGPRDAEVLAVLATHALRTDEPDRAIALAGEALRDNRLCWRCMHVLGRAYIAAGQPDRALGPLESALPLLGHRAPRARRGLEADLARARAAARTTSTPAP